MASSDISKSSRGNQTLGGFWKQFNDDVADDDVLALAAAIAYYASLSLAPLVLLFLALIGAIYPSMQEQFIQAVGQLVGSQGQVLIRSIVESAKDQPDLRQTAGWTAIVVLMAGASAVFAELQGALNRIWGVANRKLHGVGGFLRRRVLSAGVLLSVLFLTITSFIVQAFINLIGTSDEPVFRALLWTVSLLAYSGLFSLLYRFLPDARVPWSTAWKGGVMATVFFLIGRMLIALYLEHFDTAGAFGPAGALVVWLIWSYYSAAIFLLTAELLFTLAKTRGWGWVPAPEPVRPL